MKTISYVRVSTKRQAESGLGLAAQRAAVREYVKQHKATLLAEYREVETGKRKDRPKLTQAIAHARRSKAKLVVAKLDRLARNVAFLSNLMESKVDFVACDQPHANRLTVHILAAVAEDETRRISERTKAALAAYKKRGGKLGSARRGHWRGREKLRRAGAKKAAKAAGIAHARAADEAYEDLFPLLGKLRTKGLTLQEIADKLNKMGHTTRRGNQWSPTQVARVLRRMED